LALQERANTKFRPSPYDGTIIRIGRRGVIFLSIFLAGTFFVSRDLLKKMLEKSKIDGGEIMQTLADRLRGEGKEEGKLETARKLIERGVDMDIIVEATGFSRQEIEKLVETIH
jgi:predicted transposase/invertase (TIGR01784 family)